MNRPRCSICHAPGTHHVFVETMLPATSSRWRIKNLAVCARHLDEVTHELKMNHLDSPYTYVYSARLEDVEVDDVSPAIACGSRSQHSDGAAILRHEAPWPCRQRKNDGRFALRMDAAIPASGVLVVSHVGYEAFRLEYTNSEGRGPIAGSISDGRGLNLRELEPMGDHDRRRAVNTLPVGAVRALLLSDGWNARTVPMNPYAC